MISRKTILGAIAGLLCVFSAAILKADTCAVGFTPCTLPFSATVTPTQILVGNGKRTDLIVQNTGTVNNLYVVIGEGNLCTPNCGYTYGIQVPPGQTLNLEVQPDPNKGTHTYTAQISVVTSTSTTTGVYTELSQ